MHDLRTRLNLKSDAAPLPGEAAYEDTEIGRAPGQLPAASPFESTAPTKFRVISYDENSCKVDEFSDLDSVGRYAGKPGMVWIQVLGITDPQIVHIVGAFFDIPMLAQEDILTATSRPKFEEHGEKLLAIARAVRIGVEEDTPRGQQISSSPPRTGSSPSTKTTRRSSKPSRNASPTTKAISVSGTPAT